MACWGSDSLRGCSKSPHQGGLEVPKREDKGACTAPHMGKGFPDLERELFQEASL